MQKKALVIMDSQNDITKNYRDIIGNINKAIDWAVDHSIHIIYILISLGDLLSHHIIDAQDMIEISK